MKKGLIFGFVALMVGLGMSACDGAQTGAVGTSESGSVRELGAGDIAFIRMDSLIGNYNRYIDLGSEFETKATKVQSDLEARARRLQNEMMDAQEKVEKGLVTRSQAASLQEQLQRKGEDFENSRQTQLSSLAEEEQVMLNQVTYAITQYVAKFNSDLRFKMILTTSGGTPILHADPALDITAEILDGLNAEYAAEQNTK